MTGSIINNMPPRPDDIQRRARDAERRAREQAAARSGQAMQIGAGGITVTDGGSITIEGSGALNVGSGALNSAGSISAATDITAGGTVQGADLVSTGGASVTGALTAGTVSSGNVTSSGQVQSNGAPFLSVPSHNYVVNKGNWVAGWIDSDGTIGTSPSSATVKVDLTAMDGTELDKVTAYWGRYAWDAPDAPLKVFVLAEDVQAAGFGPDVAPLVEGEPQDISADPTNPVMVQPGNAWTVNYSQLVVPLIAACKAQSAQIAALEARLTKAGIA